MDGREKKKVSFLLPREVYDALREQALESRRSTAGYMRLILKRYAAYLKFKAPEDKEKGMTLQGAKQRLKMNKEKTAQTAEVVDRLKQIREELVKLRKSLDYLT